MGRNGCNMTLFRGATFLSYKILIVSCKYITVKMYGQNRNQTETEISNAQYGSFVTFCNKNGVLCAHSVIPSIVD